MNQNLRVFLQGFGRTDLNESFTLFNDFAKELKKLLKAFIPCPYFLSC
jgi:hypothetical protein